MRFRFSHHFQFFKTVFFTALICCLGACGGGSSDGLVPEQGGNHRSTPTPTPTISDLTPDVFSFEHIVDGELSTEYLSGNVRISGLSSSAPIFIAGGSYAINGGDFTSAEGEIRNGQTLQIKTVSADAFSTDKSVNIVVGTTSVNFVVTTRQIDTIPDSFKFVGKAEDNVGVFTLSASVTLGGFDGELPIKIVGGEYCLDSAACTHEQGVVKAGQQLKLRVETPVALDSTAVASVDINGISAQFKVKTQTNSAPVWQQLSNMEALQAPLISMPEGTNLIRSADIDGDGDMDLLSVSYSSIAWHENDGAQRFTTHTIAISNGRQLKSVAIVDMDGDGDMDVLTTPKYHGNVREVTYYENDGTQKFTEHAVATIPPAVTFEAIADIDGDGDMDVVLQSSWDKPVSWYENDGAQNFIERVITTTRNGVRSASVADIDGDGDMDMLLLTDSNDSVAWYENDGAQSFTEHVIATAAQTYSVDVGVADMDGDGDIDVLCLTSWLGNLEWYENDGAGSFTEHVLGTTAYSAGLMGIADIDSDGDMDVLLLSSNGNNVVWYENDGAQRFTIQTLIAVAGASVAAADFNNDGIFEILSGSSVKDTIAISTLATRSYWAPAGQPYYLTEGATDVDGEALVYSIHTVQGASGDTAFFAIDPATGDITFSAAPGETVPSDSNGDNRYEVWISVTDGYSTFNRLLSIKVYDDDNDDDNDGVMDVEDTFPLNPAEAIDTDSDGIGNNADMDDDDDGVPDSNDNAPLDGVSRHVPVWLNSAEAADMSIIGQSAYNATYVTSVDFDGDGDIDVLLSADSNISSGNVTWYENQEDQNFAVHTIHLGERDYYLGRTRRVCSVSAVDMDGDSDSDVLMGCGHDDTLVWYENDGAQNLRKRTIATREGLLDVSVVVSSADIDGDGDMDVLLGASAGNAVLWYENNGSERFTEHGLTTTSYGVRSVAAVDMDSDGDLDVLSASFNDDTLAWLENDGEQNFTEHRISLAANGAMLVASADMDGDGDMDVVSANYWRKFVDDGDTSFLPQVAQVAEWRGIVAWHENDGTERFAEHAITTFSVRSILVGLNNIERDGATSVAVVDIDGDGDMDVALASFMDNTVSWYENEGTQNFVEHILTTTASGARSVTAADINNDGVLEIISASHSNNTVAAYSLTERRYEVAVGSTLTVTENASDEDGNRLVYGINVDASASPDAEFFSIDATTGALTFSGVNSVTNPQDANGDNVYFVRVSVSDGFSVLNRLVAVEVVE